jgi:nickel-dependent lactate racemase
MHRPSTYEEKVAKLGQAIVNRYRVIDNEPQNPDALVNPLVWQAHPDGPPIVGRVTSRPVLGGLHHEYAW